MYNTSLVLDEECSSTMCTKDSDDEDGACGSLILSAEASMTSCVHDDTPSLESGEGTDSLLSFPFVRSGIHPIFSKL